MTTRRRFLAACAAACTLAAAASSMPSRAQLLFAHGALESGRPHDKQRQAAKPNLASRASWETVHPMRRRPVPALV